jgi:D-arginine dehydrogenase
MDMDVHAIHSGFVRRLRAAGGRIATDAGVLGLTRDGGGWRVETAQGEFRAPVVINAAGAWGDELARLAGAAPVGLVPQRRTAILFEPPAGMETAAWPITIDLHETVYFKPDAGMLLGCPADETPSPPCDAQPEELDVAIAADRIQALTTLEIRRIAHRWAGLRTFVADKTPVVGFDDALAGFFWLVGQGGYGIQTAPAMGRVAAELAAGRGIPADAADLGVTEAVLGPRRLRPLNHGEARRSPRRPTPSPRPPSRCARGG